MSAPAAPGRYTRAAVPPGSYHCLYFKLNPYDLVTVVATVEPFSSAVTAPSTQLCFVSFLP